MRVTLKTGMERIIDALVDGIVAFTDYFVVQKRVTLSETAIFLFSLSWTLWFIFMGVYASETALTRSIWVTLFAMTTVAHFVSFLFNNLVGRACVVCGYAFVWCFLTLLTAYTGTIAPAVPTLAVMTLLSIFIAVRLFREGAAQE